MTEQKQKLKILLIEDDRTSRILAAQTLLNDKSVQVEKILATNKAEGMEKFIREKPDITFLDIELPDGNGLQMLPLMMQYLPDAFIVMMTGSADAQDVHEAKKAGAMGYILKPFSAERMKKTVQAYRAYRQRLDALPVDQRHHLASIEVSREEIRYIFEQMAAEQEAKSAASPEDSLNGIIAGWEVLFVDDYLANRENALHHLGDYGCRLKLMDSGVEAQASMLETPYDMVFLDKDLPDRNGYQVCSALRTYEKKTARPGHTYVIGMLPSHDEAATQKWLQAGMDDYLVKPCRFKDVEKMMVKFARRYRKDQHNRFVA